MHFDTEGTYTLQYTATDSCGNETIEERTVEVVAPPIYGAYWDASSNPQWVRTDSAENFSDPQPAVNNGNGSSPFDDIMPWSGMQIVEDANAGTLVAIPKFWYKITRNIEATEDIKIQISNTAQEGFDVSPAHADRGDGAGERDVVYIGRYHCSDSDFKSSSGVLPKASLTREAFRTSIHALGNDIWQNDFAMYWTIRMLYLVEFANWNSQLCIGNGCGTGSKINEGSTDAMQYHTGTDAIDKSTYGNVQYRHIEGLWSNVYDWIDGLRFGTEGTGTVAYAIDNPASFSDTTGGTDVGFSSVSTSFITGYTIPGQANYAYAMTPLNNNVGNGTTYICDKADMDPSYSGVPKCGGAYGFRNQEQGLFYFNRRSNTAIANTGSRLMKLPTA